MRTPLLLCTPACLRVCVYATHPLGVVKQSYCMHTLQIVQRWGKACTFQFAAMPCRSLHAHKHHTGTPGPYFNHAHSLSAAKLCRALPTLCLLYTSKELHFINQLLSMGTFATPYLLICPEILLCNIRELPNALPCKHHISLVQTLLHPGTCPISHPPPHRHPTRGPHPAKTSADSHSRIPCEPMRSHTSLWAIRSMRPGVGAWTA